MTALTSPILVIGVVLTALLFAFGVRHLSVYGCRCHGHFSRRHRLPARSPIIKPSNCARAHCERRLRTR